MVRFVTMKILTLFYGLPKSLIKIIEEFGSLGQQAMCRCLVNIKAVALEVLHNTLNGHRVQVSQLCYSRYERTVEAGVLQRCERRLAGED